MTEVFQLYKDGRYTVVATANGRIFSRVGFDAAFFTDTADVLFGEDDLQDTGT
jgi:hypothetical protein